MTVATVGKTEKLSGEVRVPPSKSYTHRALIATSLGAGVSFIKNPLISDDTLATVNACRSFGPQLERKEDGITVKGLARWEAPSQPIECGESAATLRFMTPLAALTEGVTTLTGRKGLLKRPIGPLVQALQQLGVRCESLRGYPPVKVYGGGIAGGKTSIPGDVSSQYVSGLLFASPLAQGEVEIRIIGSLESLPYVRLTLHVLDRHGVKVRVSENYQVFTVPGGQGYRPQDHQVTGDFSSAAFLLAAAAITGSEIRVKNLDGGETPHPDREILTLLERMGAAVACEGLEVTVSGGELKAVEVDARNIPDLVPVCAALASYAEGETVIKNARRLRIKESDRLKTTASELAKMGAKIVEQEDGLRVEGPCRLRGAELDSHGDHRIAMACAVAALRAEGETRIHGAECVSKSYPDFYMDLARLGGKVKLG